MVSSTMGLLLGKVCCNLESLDQLVFLINVFPCSRWRDRQTIPLNKDFGVHCKSYYSLDVTYFKVAMDKSLPGSLLNHYWVNTLSSSTLLTNAEYTTGQVSSIVVM